MPGKTGKRAKPPGICGRCGKQIARGGAFMREPKADFHESCWWDKQEESKNKRSNDLEGGSMNGMKEVEFEIQVTGKGWMLVPEGEDPKKYIESSQAALGGNKLWQTAVVATNIEPRKER